LDASPTTGAFAWWLASQDYKSYEGWTGTLEYVENIFRTKGPFCGVLGFSQGATLCGILAAIQQVHPESPIHFNFAVLFAGFKARAENLQYLFDNGKLKTPAFQVIGERDPYRSGSEAYWGIWENFEVLTFDGGHLIPKDEVVLKSVANFVQNQSQ